VRSRAAVLLFLLASTGLAPSARAGEREDAVALLRRLASVPGVSGSEQRVREAIRAALPSWATPEVDNLGNLTVTVGAGAPRRLLLARMDEPGYVVAAIEPSGYLRVQRLATEPLPALFDQFHLGQPVVVSTRRGDVPAVVAIYSTHLWRGEGPPITAPVTDEDLVIDIGARSDDAVRAAGVGVLDPVVIARRLVDLADGGIAGPFLGVRAGCAVLAGLLARLEPAKVKGTLTVAFATQGFVEARGAGRLASRLELDEVIVVDPLRATPGGGPALAVPGKGPFSPALYARIVERAAGLGIALQSVTSDRPGQGEIFQKRAQVAQLGAPVRYPVTPAVIVDGRDLVAAARLLQSLVEDGPPAAIDRAAVPAERVPAAASDAAPTRSGAPVAGAATGREGAFAILKQLVETPGVSTHEERVRDAIRRLLPAWAKAEVDARGNLRIVAGPERGARQLLFIAHMDETGYLVTRIADDGMLEVKPVGGFYEMLYEGQVVLVHAAQGDVGGVVPPRADYVAGGTAPMAFGGAQVRVDLGTRDRAASERLGVAPGDMLTIPKAFQHLAGTMGSGRAVDDRAGCTALLLALRALDPRRLRNRVTFAFSVEEETGLDGAAALAKELASDAAKGPKPDLAIAVDTFVSSETPLERHGLARGILGRGPVVRAIDNSNITDRSIVDRILALAAQANLPIQAGLTRGGNDASVFPALGVPAAAISWPTVYSHSPVEVIDERDLERLGDLVRVIAERW
jgi:putative aminopeptidase FrvX